MFPLSFFSFQYDPPSGVPPFIKKALISTKRRRHKHPRYHSYWRAVSILTVPGPRHLTALPCGNTAGRLQLPLSAFHACREITHPLKSSTLPGETSDSVYSLAPTDCSLKYFRPIYSVHRVCIYMYVTNINDDVWFVNTNFSGNRASVYPVAVKLQTFSQNLKMSVKSNGFENTGLFL